MAADHPIPPPFPDDIDRDRFGDWLSGFTDGEGCFHLGFSVNRNGSPGSPRAIFVIGLRADDEQIIRLIQSFWQRGRHHFRHPGGTARNGKLAIYYEVYGWRDLATVIVPHFEKYPLRAKKAADFSTWREGVLLGFSVSQRKTRWHGSGHHHGQRKLEGGKWHAHEVARFKSLKDAMRLQRAYQASAIELPTPPQVEPSLFDGLL